MQMQRLVSAVTGWELVCAGEVGREGEDPLSALQLGVGCEIIQNSVIFGFFLKKKDGRAIRCLYGCAIARVSAVVVYKVFGVASLCFYRGFLRS